MCVNDGRGTSELVTGAIRSHMIRALTEAEIAAKRMETRDESRERVEKKLFPV